MTSHGELPTQHNKPTRRNRAPALLFRATGRCAECRDRLYTRERAGVAQSVDRPKAASRRRGRPQEGLVKPKLAAEIAYRGWTHGEKLRHVSFKSLRVEADKVTVFRLS